MGDRAVRWALQQTQFDMAAQMILTRICNHLDDRRGIWSWAKKIDVIAKECNRSVDSIQRYMMELEGKERSGEPSGVEPVLFRGYRFQQGFPTEYIILGPNKTATEAYLTANYPADFLPAPPQLAVGYPPATCGRVEPDPPATCGTPPATCGNILETSLVPLPLTDSSNTEKGPATDKLQEIGKTALKEIEIRTGRQQCFTWYSPAHPVDFKNGVLTLSVPTIHHHDYLSKTASRHVLLASYRSAGLSVCEITFVARDLKTDKIRAARAP